jgi:pyruvate dehydrogenase kinase 2/3/4
MIRDEIIQLIKTYSLRPQNSVSIKQMVDFSKTPSAITLLRGSHFVHREIPIRLAHRVVELEHLPYNLSDMPSIKTVKEWYSLSFQELLDLREYKLPDDVKLNRAYFQNGKGEIDADGMEYIKTFTKCIEKIKTRHDPTQMAISQGIIELKETWKANNNSMLENELLPTAIQAFLDRF